MTTHLLKNLIMTKPIKSKKVFVFVYKSSSIYKTNPDRHNKLTL